MNEDPITSASRVNQERITGKPRLRVEFVKNKRDTQERINNEMLCKKGGKIKKKTVDNQQTTSTPVNNQKSNSKGPEKEIARLTHGRI